MFALQATPYTLPLLLDALLCSLSALTIWRRRRPGSGVVPFVIMFMGLIWWVFCNAATYALVDVSLKQVFEVLLFVGVTTVPATWFIFITIYTGHEKWLTRRNVLLLAVEPILVIVMTATNDAHHLFWATISVADLGGFTGLVTTHGSLFWLHTAYSYLLILSSVVLMLRELARSPTIYRGQGTTLLIGLFVPWLINLISISLNATIDLTPFAFTLTCLAFVWSLLRFRLFNIVPVARAMLVESMSDGVIVIDQNGRIVDINPAAIRMAGVTSVSYSIGKTLTELIPDRAAMISRFSLALQTDTEITDPRSGHIFDLHIAPLYNRDQQLTGRAVTLHDITTLKQASNQIAAQNESLQQANRALDLARQQADDANALKSQFLATVSHELRTPLNAVVGYAQLIAEGVAGPLTAKQSEFEERIIVNAKHLLSLINDVLDLSKIEAGRMAAMRRPYPLRKTLEEVIAQGKVLADQKQLSITLTIADTLPSTLVGDAGHVQQILLNLISNAIKFTDQGSVTVSAQRGPGQTWQLIVTDTGIGIAPDLHAAIFEEFRQVDHGSTRKYGGTGLGLAIVKRLATLMGGDIQVSSVPEHGSTFTLTLPFIAGVDQAAPESPTMSSPAAIESPITIGTSETPQPVVTASVELAGHSEQATGR